MARFAFGRDRRIRRRADFLRVQAGGQRATTPHFVLLVAAQAAPAVVRSEADDAPPAPSRLGVVATRKVGNAAQRNRIKRLCRECFRLWPDFVPPGIELVVIAREGADELGLAQVRAEWTQVRPTLLKRCQAAAAKVR